MNTQDNVGTTCVSGDVRFTTASAHVPSRDWRTTQLERVDEYEQLAVLQADPDARFSAVIRAELIRTAFLLEELVHEALSNSPSTAEGIRAAEPMVVLYLRAVRQIGRDTRLEICRKNFGVRHVMPRVNDRA